MNLGDLGGGSGVGVVLVFGVAGGFELEGAVLHVEPAGQAVLQRVEHLRGVAVVEAAVVNHDVRGQGRH